jgi:hypothetical protein
VKQNCRFGRLAFQQPACPLRDEEEIGMLTTTRARFFPKLLTAVLFIWAYDPAAAATRIEGQVQGGGAPIANSTVTLWSASANAPSQLAQVKTDTNGRFQISAEQSPSKDSSLYLVAKGGEPFPVKQAQTIPPLG